MCPKCFKVSFEVSFQLRHQHRFNSVISLSVLLQGIMLPVETIEESHQPQTLFYLIKVKRGCDKIQHGKLRRTCVGLHAPDVSVKFFVHSHTQKYVRQPL